MIQNSTNTEELKQTYFKVKTETVTHIKDLIQEIKWLKSQELNEKIKELEQEIENLKNTKKYGLVWDSEKEPEQVVLACQTKLPILKEVKDKKIINNNTWDSNILIEWDNYHALQVLNYTHKEAIDVIYIDPPYNTWNKDFIYNDKYIDKEDTYRHSKWLNFMEKRLRLAHNLLKEDGVIFISIDDNEQAQLKLLCDEIFWEENFSSLIWQKQDPKVDRNTNSKQINREKRIHEYIFIIFKNKYGSNFSKVMRLPDWSKEWKNPDKDIRWPYQSWILSFEEWHKNEDKNSIYYYSITLPSWRIMTRHFFITKDNFIRLNNDNRIYFPKWWDWVPRLKVFQFEEKEYYLESIIRWFWTSSSAKDELEEIFFNREIFDTPKPLKLIKELIRASSKKNSIILDFMAWSWTTWHAVLDLNKEDWGNRKFILCTNNENNICEEITYERIKRVSNWYTNSKWKEIEWLWGNLRYYKTDFVEVESLKDITDKQKLELTYNAWELLAIKEWIYNELEKNKFWQIFENETDIVAIYFAESTRKVWNMKERLQEIQTQKWGKVKWYIYNNPFDKNDFKDLKGLELKDIPDPILKVYREINRV